MQDFVTILSNFGFPVALSIYLLGRFEKKIENLTDKIEELNTAVGRLSDKVEDIKNGRN